LAAALVNELLALPDEDLRPLADRLAAFLTSGEPTHAFLTVAEAAERLDVHPNTVYRMILRGRLRATRAGRLWRIPADELDRVDPSQVHAPRPPRRPGQPPAGRRFAKLVRDLH
jgi:excisionase family DNA binding protein